MQEEQVCQHVHPEPEVLCGGAKVADAAAMQKDTNISGAKMTNAAAMHVLRRSSGDLIGLSVPVNK